MRLKVMFVLVLIYLFLGVNSVFAKIDLPAPMGYVNDFAEILSPQFEATLNQNLIDFESKTTNEISVVTVKSFGDMTVEEYAADLFQQWGIGKKAQDNGLLLLFAPNDKKVRIEAGYGLEPIITDGRSGEILDTEFIPEYKKGNYEQAILNTINKIEPYLFDQQITPPEARTLLTFSEAQTLQQESYFGLTILIGITYLFAFLARSKEFYAGGLIGAIAGFFIAGVTAAIGFGIFGLILDYILSKNYKKLKAAGIATGFLTSQGGFRFGNGSSGGFSSGGGSSGGSFGGGSSGGGGASRSL